MLPHAARHAALEFFPLHGIRTLILAVLLAPSSVGAHGSPSLVAEGQPAAAPGIEATGLPTLPASPATGQPAVPSTTVAPDLSGVSLAGVTSGAPAGAVSPAAPGGLTVLPGLPEGWVDPARGGPGVQTVDGGHEAFVAAQLVAEIIRSVLGGVVRTGPQGNMIMVLDPGSSRGAVTMQPIAMGTPVGQIQMGILGQPAEGSSWIIRVHFADGTASTWQPVVPERVYRFDKPVIAVQPGLIVRPQAAPATGGTVPAGTRTAAAGRAPVPLPRGVTLNRVEARDAGPVLPFQGGSRPQGVGRPRIVSRQQWGAKSARNGSSNHKIERLVVHHSAGPSQDSYLKSGDKNGVVRQIQSFHQNSRGWSDIGYHFVVGPDGTIYQGRPETVVGAHSPPNTGKVGICVIGNFENEKPDNRAIVATTDLMAWLCARYKVNPRMIFKHRDFQGTACPGANLAPIVNTMKQDVIRRVEGGGLAD